MYELQFSGIKDKNGITIHEGDIVEGLIYNERIIPAVCRFYPEFAAFGLEWDRDGVTEFYPFCQICNTEFEVITFEKPCDNCKFQKDYVQVDPGELSSFKFCTAYDKRCSKVIKCEKFKEKKND